MLPLTSSFYLNLLSSFRFSCTTLTLSERSVILGMLCTCKLQGPAANFPSPALEPPESHIIFETCIFFNLAPLFIFLKLLSMVYISHIANYTFNNQVISWKLRWQSGWLMILRPWVQTPPGSS